MSGTVQLRLVGATEGYGQVDAPDAARLPRAASEKLRGTTRLHVQRDGRVRVMYTSFNDVNGQTNAFDTYAEAEARAEWYRVHLGWERRADW